MNSSKSDFDQFLEQQWKAHTKQPQLVREQLLKLQSSVLSEKQVVDVGALACHVHGEHLGDWSGGLAYIDSLFAAHPAMSNGARIRLSRQRTILLKASGTSCEVDGFDISDYFHIITLAVPAAILMGNPTHGLDIFGEALALLPQSPDIERHERLLGVMTANLTCDLIERQELSPEQKTILAIVAEKSFAIWQQVGNDFDREKASFRLTQAYIAVRKPAGYGSGRYARSANIES